MELGRSKLKQNYANNTSSLLPTKCINIDEAIVDTGASSNFVMEAAPVTNLSRNENIKVRLPNGSNLQSSHEGVIQTPALPEGARKAYVLKGLKHNLLSIATICD